MANTRYLICSKCGCQAVPTKAETGTSTLMRCVDCCHVNDPSKYANMCRQCCPSNHGTYMYQHQQKEGLL